MLWGESWSTGSAYTEEVEREDEDLNSGWSTEKQPYSVYVGCVMQLLYVARASQYWTTTYATPDNMTAMFQLAEAGDKGGPDDEAYDNEIKAFLAAQRQKNLIILLLAALCEIVLGCVTGAEMAAIGLQRRQDGAITETCSFLGPGTMFALYAALSLVG